MAIVENAPRDVDAALESLLARGPEAQANANPTKPARAPQGAEDTGEEGPSQEAAVEGQEAELEAGTDDQEDADRPADASETYEVTVDGRTIKVDRDELIRGYSRGADYRDKTTALTQERQALEAEAAEARTAWQTRQAALDQAFEFLMSADPVMAEARKTDLAKLAEEDPDAYVRLKAKVEQRTTQFQEWQRTKQEAATQEARKTVQRESQLLAQKVPEFADPTKAEGERKALAQYLSAQGFSPAEVSGVTDHRAVVVARKAMLYDRLMAGGDAAKKKVAAVPAKVVKPGAARQSPSEAAQVSTAKRRFSQTKSIEDAIAVLDAQLGS